MTRTGKIARLPQAAREELNRRLADGEVGSSLLRWLNGLPATRDVLDGLFGGAGLEFDWERLEFDREGICQQMAASPGESDQIQVKNFHRGGAEAPRKCGVGEEPPDFVLESHGGFCCNRNGDRMDVAHTAPAPEELSKSRQAALLSLLSDDDPVVYQTVREKILSYGRPATEWLRPHTVSNDPALRRRARELVIHFDRQAADDHFLAFCLRHGEDLDIEEGAWLLAQTRYPLINPDAYRALLDSYAIELGDRLEGASDPLEHLSIINRYLFRELAFGGNEENYYDPENSYLNCVLDRRKGNPINICLVYLLVSRRLRLPIAGIGLPGHFVCRYQSSAVEIYFDPFNRGKILSKGDCLQYLAHAKFGFSEETLSPISPRRLLLRICNNLHQIYQRLEQANEATRLQRYVIALGERYRTA